MQNGSWAVASGKLQHQGGHLLLHCCRDQDLPARTTPGRYTLFARVEREMPVQPQRFETLSELWALEAIEA